VYFLALSEEEEEEKNWKLCLGFVLEVQDYCLLGSFEMDCCLFIDLSFVMPNKLVLAHATMD